MIHFCIHKISNTSVSYTHLRAHETPEHLVCRLLLEQKTLQTLSAVVTRPSQKNRAPTEKV